MLQMISSFDDLNMLYIVEFVQVLKGLKLALFFISYFFTMDYDFFFILVVKRILIYELGTRYWPIQTFKQNIRLLKFKLLIVRYFVQNYVHLRNKI